MNPYVIIAVVVGFVIWTGGVWYKASSSKEAEMTAKYEEQERQRRSLTDDVRRAIRDEGDKLSQGLEAGLGKIKIVNRTVNKEIKHEKEIHHVLSDPDCSVPVSTVTRVLIPARTDPEPQHRPAIGKSDGGVRTTTSTGREADPAR